MALNRVIFIAAVLLIVACGTTTNKKVSPLPEHLTCDVDSDCTIVSLACSSCGDPVATKFSVQLVEQRQNICRNYRGPVFDCAPPGKAVCKVNRCTIIQE